MCNMLTKAYGGPQLSRQKQEPEAQTKQFTAQTKTTRRKRNIVHGANENDTAQTKQLTAQTKQLTAQTKRAQFAHSLQGGKQLVYVLRIIMASADDEANERGTIRFLLQFFLFSFITLISLPISLSHFPQSCINIFSFSIIVIT